MDYASTHQCASWMRKAISRESCDTALELAAHRLKNVQFDTVVFTGVSGAIFAPVLAHKLGKEIVVVRKTMDTHSDNTIEGYRHVSKYIIVDDFVSTGATVKYLIKRMHQFAPDAICAGVYTYNTLPDGVAKINCGYASPDNYILQELIDEALGEIRADERTAKVLKELEA